jgi:AcrR family transcriptional regulator
LEVRLSDVWQISERPQAQRSHAAALEAAVALLTSDGFGETTIERIAATSGVSTATLYKHWPSKNALVAEAFGLYMNRALPIVATDDALADLRSFVHQAVTFHGQEGDRTFVQLLSACALEPSGQAYLHAYYLGPRREQFAQLWARAVESGHVVQGLDADIALDLMFGPAVFRLLRGADDARQLHHTVDQVLTHLTGTPHLKEEE